MPGAVARTSTFALTNATYPFVEALANQGVMKQLAEQSNGDFYLLKNYKKALEDISKRKDITTISYAETTFDDLIEYVLIFVLIFLLLSTEWFLRRWFGSY
jgi:hypothetical protein